MEMKKPENWQIDFGIPIKYNYDNNTVLFRMLDNKMYRMLLLWGGVFEVPNPDKHMLLIFHPPHMRELTDENDDTIHVGFAMLVNVKSFKWKLDSSAPVTFFKNDKGSAPIGQERTISLKEGTGISVREDGSVVLQSNGATITLTDNGVMIDGEVTYGQHTDDNMGIVMKNPLTFLPSFIALPLPERIINVAFVQNIAKKIESLQSMIESLLNLIAIVRL